MTGAKDTGPGILLHVGFSPALTWQILERFGVTNFAAAPTRRSARTSAIITVRPEHGMIIVNGWHDDVRSEVQPGSMGQPLPGFSCAVLHDDRDEPKAAGTPGRIAASISVRDMRAVEIRAFGRPEGLAVVDIPDPRPADGQALIATEAIGVGCVDAVIRRGVLGG